MSKWLETQNGIINLRYVKRITRTSLGGVSQILAWYDDDIDHCEILAEYTNDAVYEIENEDSLLEKHEGYICAELMLRRIKGIVDSFSCDLCEVECV